MVERIVLEGAVKKTFDAATFDPGNGEYKFRPPRVARSGRLNVDAGAARARFERWPQGLARQGRQTGRGMFGTTGSIDAQTGQTRESDHRRDRSATDPQQSHNKRTAGHKNMETGAMPKSALRRAPHGAALLRRQPSLPSALSAHAQPAAGGGDGDDPGTPTPAAAQQCGATHKRHRHGPHAERAGGGALPGHARLRHGLHGRLRRRRTREDAVRHQRRAPIASRSWSRRCPRPPSTSS